MDLVFLEFLAANGKFSELQESLHFPGALSHPLPADGPQRLQSIEARLRGDPDTETLADFLQLNLLASMLTGPADPAWMQGGFAATVSALSGLLHPSGDLERFMRGRWLAVPVLLAVAGRAALRHFIAGVVPGAVPGCSRPGWADGVMDADAHGALAAAAGHPGLLSLLPPDSGLFLFPLVPPGKALLIRGRSLGLPLLIGFHCLACGEPWPRQVAATGELGPGGSVGPVGHLEEKAAAAAERGFRALICPLENGTSAAVKNLEAVPVRRADEALLFARLYAPGRGRELILLSEMLDDPAAFIGGMERVDPCWVDWACGRGRCRPVVEKIFGEPHHLKGFSRTVRFMAADWKLERARVFAGLIEAEDIERGARVSPAATLGLCTAALAVSNHRGDIAGACKWAEAGGRLLDEALRSDLDVCADFINNRLVLQHNRYRFEPEPGAEVGLLLEVLEQRGRVCAAAGCKVDVKLGELHGTLAQNCGFCGPGHLEECLRHAMRAMDAFGRCEVSEFFPDYLRQLGYLVYAYLDAGKREKALKTLGAFTGADGWDDLLRRAREKRLDRWHHAAVARFLAENPGDMAAEAYLAIVRDEAPQMVEEDHPWQLWLWNLGRIAAGNRLPTSARSLFEQSLAICRLEKLGPTVRLMALLPLSGLRILESLPEDMAAIEAEIRKAAEEIDSQRFNLLLESPLSRAVEPVWWKPEVFFPFTYR